ncbi:flagellar basal body P-ring formation chaperone FlgA [Falsihalocynthiibacter sp. SS001]|uniref:flagellar basal body P-ring formation chaperone FlgA n=1 Tax=Falsihalocynthiibacter sp. SS001 TaxID=3349698 RepID=UPI0036D3270C
MRALVYFIVCVLVLAEAHADTMLAARTIPSRTVITSDDFTVSTDTIPGTFQTPTDVIGLEARTTIYAGRPIRRAEVGSPAMVERNQIVTLTYIDGGLNISVEARSLGRGGANDVLRFMNLASRTTVSGVVQADGSILVQ